MVGLVLLALFARQTVAFGWTVCIDAGAPRASASMTDMPGMPGMDHERHGTGDGRRPAPLPDRNSGCDHSIPAGDCGFGSGCVVAVPGSAVVVTEAITVPTEAVRFPGPTRPLSLEFTPDTPPPRS